MEKNLEKTAVFYFDNACNIRGSKSASHYHDCLEIYYMKDGACNYFIDDKSHKVETGDVVFIPQGVIHKTNYESEYHARWLINCSYNYLPSSVLPYLSKIPHLFKRSKLTEECEKVMLKISEEYALNDNFSNDALRGLVYELIFLLFRNSSGQTTTHSCNLIAEQAVKYIQDNYQNQISLSETALTLSVSPEHLSRAFKKDTGFGFSEYLTLLRLQKAEYILKNEPGKSVNEVAFACGFNDSNYFSYKFKKQYGVSPSSVKKNK